MWCQRRIFLPWSQCLVVCVAAAAVAYGRKSPSTRPRRSIIGVPEISFAPHGRRFVVGYDGQCRPLFDGDDRDFEYYGPERAWHLPSTAPAAAPRPPSPAAVPQYSIRDVLLAVMANVNEANEMIHRFSRKTWRRLQGESSQPIKY